LLVEHEEHVDIYEFVRITYFFKRFHALIIFDKFICKYSFQSSLLKQKQFGAYF